MHGSRANPKTSFSQAVHPTTHGLGIPLSKVGFPIRISADQSSFAAPRGFSQRSTSFIASQRQGIHQMPLFHLIALIINAHPALGVRSRIRVRILTGGTLIRKTSLQDRTDDSLRSGTEPTKHRARSFGSHEMPGVRDRNGFKAITMLGTIFSSRCQISRACRSPMRQEPHESIPRIDANLLFGRA